jgi:uncharacterized protein DUF3631
MSRIPSSADAYDELRHKCARWVADHAGALKDARPDVPEALSDRARDNWTPLLAIAEAIGGEWTEEEATEQLLGPSRDDREVRAGR